MPNTYAYKELRELPEEKLTNDVTDLLYLINASGGHDKIHLALQAQILLNEIGRREQDKYTKVIVNCTWQLPL